MTFTNIYEDISARTGGNVYIGVVGPVRTGKSTFIRRFMEKVVLPNIASEGDLARAKDEMPQSAAGRTVMTTEPKFVPDEAVKIKIGNSSEISVKLADCVGYIVPGAQGQLENGVERNVMTMWSDKPMPFGEAAEFGTTKVINEHSTVALLVTTDGSVGEIPRENYVDAEERVVAALKKSGKPFAVILNSAHPDSPESAALAYSLEEKYGRPVALVNCLELDFDDAGHILDMVLREFPIREIAADVPSWIDALPEGHPVRTGAYSFLFDRAEKIRTLADAEKVFEDVDEDGVIKKCVMEKSDYGKGVAYLRLETDGRLFYRTVGELTGLDIDDEGTLIRSLTELAGMKKTYEKYASAISDVESTGYGIVTPGIDDLTLEEPEIIKTQGSYGVRLRASAPSVHLIKADIRTELEPVVGSVAQSEELVKYLLDGFENDPRALWESNMFGKSLYDLMKEGLNNKLGKMPEEARRRLGETLQRLINEGNGGLLCIIL